jgi:ferrous iron transport protein A
MAPLHRAYSVLEVVPAVDDDGCARRLEELGFLPGERVTVIGTGWPGAKPLAVRVGLSTYALRAEEAACVRIATAGDRHE